MGDESQADQVAGSEEAGRQETKEEVTEADLEIKGAREFSESDEAKVEKTSTTAEFVEGAKLDSAATVDKKTEEKD